MVGGGFKGGTEKVISRFDRIMIAWIEVPNELAMDG